MSLLTPHECAEQFDLYAEGCERPNGLPDRAYAYRHCAAFLREHCANPETTLAQLGAKVRAAYNMANLIRPRVRDEVKDGRGTMAVFDRARMEALAKALATFDAS